MFSLPSDGLLVTPESQRYLCYCCMHIFGCGFVFAHTFSFAFYFAVVACVFHVEACLCFPSEFPPAAQFNYNTQYYPQQGNLNSCLVVYFSFVSPSVVTGFTLPLTPFIS